MSNAHTTTAQTTTTTDQAAPAHPTQAQAELPQAQVTTAYRIQSADRDLADLLDPEQQQTFPMDEDDEQVRHGVSGCETLADLAAYIACYPVEAPCPVLVRITGPLSDDTPCYEADGEVLLLPTSAEIISDDSDFFDLVSDLVDLRSEQYLDCPELREIAAERI